VEPIQHFAFDPPGSALAELYALGDFQLTAAVRSPGFASWRFARVVAADLPHHVTQRGNRRQQVFFGNDDYEAYCTPVGGRLPRCRRAQVKSVRLGKSVHIPHYPVAPFADLSYGWLKITL
jgi:hypothetical protein